MLRIKIPDDLIGFLKFPVQNAWENDWKRKFSVQNEAMRRCLTSMHDVVFVLMVYARDSLRLPSLLLRVVLGHWTLDIGSTKIAMLPSWLGHARTCLDMLGHARTWYFI